MPDITAEAATAAPTNDDLVTKLTGPLDKFISQIESIEDVDKIKNDIPGFQKIFRQTLVQYDPTRAGLLKTCMDLSQTDNKELYDSYVVACKNNRKKYYSRSNSPKHNYNLGAYWSDCSKNTDHQWRRYSKTRYTRTRCTPR